MLKAIYSFYVALLYAYFFQYVQKNLPCAKLTPGSKANLVSFSDLGYLLDAVKHTKTNFPPE